ncbi:MAG: alpha/beta fold hydrolase [Roseovarius pacificus]|nr:alpha/beta fold hydrolase [Roseovarius pacificus]
MKAKKTHTHPDEILNVITEDGFPICGDIWHGDSGPIVVIHSATGVQACYYARFARWLAGLGATVVTFDYRGIGKSRFKSTKDLKAGWIDWGVLDAEAVLTYAIQRWPGRPLTAIGHSIGGFTLGLARSSLHIKRIVMVGAQFAFWRDYAVDQRRFMYLKWHLLMPAITKLVGYFPGKKLGWLEDLPRGVAQDWSRMGPRFETSVISRIDSNDLAVRHGATHARILAISLTDDPFGTEAAICRLLGYFKNANQTHLRIAPENISVPEIGHFAFFHSRFEHALWPIIAEWLMHDRLPDACPGRVMPTRTANV